VGTPERAAAHPPTLPAVGHRSPDLHYVPYADLGGGRVPNVVVDGSPTDGTLLCLSHWPGIGSPARFAADLSAQMAFAYLDAFDRHPGAEAVSNNHFDQDGLVGVCALVEPAEALARRELLVEVARAGDFAATTSRAAARISMVLAAYADPARSPLEGMPEDDDARCALLYDELLGRLPELSDRPDAWRDLWAEEDDTLSASIDALASGTATITELPELDLAVVEVARSAPDAGGHRFGGQWVSGLHPIAVHGATERGALLTVRGRHYELGYRYESWVQFCSRRVRARVDLAPLAVRLSDAEADAGGTAHWVADPVSALTPTLAPAERAESALAPDVVRDVVAAHLRAAPPAWDPRRITR
jgi:hypothetical protein